jgi:catechol 2,3-dioxygenase-like lactoylglutathione lyase family enzyme
VSPKHSDKLWNKLSPNEKRRPQPIRNDTGDDQVPEPWAIRSTLVVVADLDRSVRFYRGIGPFEEVFRTDSVAVLGNVPSGSVFLILRERQGLWMVRYGQQSLGLRSITFNVISVSELDRIEFVLRNSGRFTSRWTIADGASELVRGRDPDNLPLVFVSHDEKRVPTTEYYRAIANLEYSLDV